MLANARRNLAQPPKDLRLLIRQGVARQCRREILLEEQRRFAPGVGERTRRERIFVVAKWFIEPGQMVLHRWQREQSTGAREIATGPHQREVIVEGAIPAPALPRHGPAVAAPLDSHFGLMNRPGRHRLHTRGILRDDRLENRERRPASASLSSCPALSDNCPDPFPT